MKYYIDTAIWFDYMLDRKGFKGENLSKYAFDLFIKIIFKDNIAISDILIEEMKQFLSEEEINSMMFPFKNKIIIIKTTGKQVLEAEKISKIRNVPKGDVLHAIVARDNNLIFITRDKHFNKLKDISDHFKPEDI